MHGLKRRVQVQNTYVVEVAVAIERRGWVRGTGPVLRARRKASPRCPVGRRQMGSTGHCGSIEEQGRS